MSNEQKYLYIEVERDLYVTHHADPDDRWDRDSTDGTVTVKRCIMINKDEYQSLPCPTGVTRGDKVYLVWAQYSTGDSFGRDGAQFELCGVFASEQDAEAEKQRLQEVNDYSVPWIGFFESLDSINVQAIFVQ